MGTRNLTAVYLNGEYKVAQYGQWDGYPAGQGLRTLHFLQDEMDEQLFRSKVNKAQFIDPKELRGLWKQYGADDNGMISFWDMERMKDDHPEFSRDTGAGIFSLVQNAPSGIKLQNMLDFAADGLSCEWAWVIDLDKRTLEGFKGSQTEPLGERERFAFLEDKAEGGYHPCKLVASWSFDALPTDEDFLSVLEAKEEEDEGE